MLPATSDRKLLRLNMALLLPANQPYVTRHAARHRHGANCPDPPDLSGGLGWFCLWPRACGNENRSQCPVGGRFERWRL